MLTTGALIDARWPTPVEPRPGMGPCGARKVGSGRRRRVRYGTPACRDPRGTAGVGHNLHVERHDLPRTFPDGSFDLVCAQYLHTPLAFPRARVLTAAARAVVSGGLLVVVDHGSVRPWAWNPDPDTRFPTPGQVLAELTLDPALWHTERLDSPQREAIGPHGQVATVIDTVIAVRRI